MIRRLLHGCVLAFLVVMATLAPATADTSSDGLALSVDGTHWTDVLSTPLFAPDVLWVPGDVRRASLYVANHGPTAAEVSIRLRTSDDGLVQSGDLVLEARMAGESWRPLARLGGSALLNRVALPAGEPRRIDVRATFRPGSTNQSQSASVDLAFEIELREALAAPTGGHSLPETGAPLLGLPAMIGLGLLILGAVLVRRTAKQEPDVVEGGPS